MKRNWRCNFFHAWTVWSEIMRATYVEGGGEYLYQRRNCTRCNKIESRSI